MTEEKEEAEEEKIEEGFINGNIPLIINSYADIFSSFDSRPISEKALSIDFLSECKRAARDKADLGLEIIISVPKNRRIVSDEFKIKRRLKEHFHKHFLEKEKETQKIIKEGIRWIIIGFIAVIAAIVIRAFKQTPLLDSIIEPILVIPGWFAIWEGLTKIFVRSKDKELDYNFYKKMKDCKVSFKGY